MMETPNTRSRLKRGLDANEQDDVGQVRWQHDQRLRRAVLQATANDEFIPPTPTQKPSLPPASSASTLPSGSVRARKRRCRQHRSLPSASTSLLLVAPDAIGLAGPSSAPSLGSAGLDALLKQAMETFSLESGRRATLTNNTGSRGSRGAERGETPKGREAGRMFAEEAGSAVSSKEADRGRPENARPRGTPLRPLETSGNASDAARQMSMSSFISAPPKRGEMIDAILSPSPRLRSSQNENKPACVPRIGLRPTTSGEVRHAHPPAPARAFKSPLIAQQPVRSSPRRVPNPPVRESSAASPSIHCGQGVRPDSRILPPVVIRPSATPKSGKTAVMHVAERKSVSSVHGPSGASASTRLPARPVSPLPAKEPSSDGVGTGDESFDSFVGLLEGGGPEVEELLRKVDGSHEGVERGTKAEERA